MGTSAHCMLESESYNHLKKKLWMYGQYHNEGHCIITVTIHVHLC